MKAMYEYKGLTIYSSDEGILSKDCNYIDSKGNTVNKVKPLFQGYAKWTKQPNKNTGHLHVSMFGGDNRESENDSDVEYTKSQIDSYLQHRKEYIVNKWKAHRAGKIRVYILNNVKITVIYQKNNFKYIYVNDKALRSVSLNENWTFEDVLKQVYLNVISSYTINKTLPKYILDRKEEVINLSVLPLHEYIGFKVKLNKEVFIIRDVWDYYYDDKADFRLLTDKGDKLITLSDIPKMELLGEVKGDISILINKSNFYE